MARKFFVDWSDAAFPRILDIKFASEYAEPLSLAEAKAEVVDHFRHDIDHAREQIKKARELRVADIAAG
ncbi:hypothetical protein [Streptomyces sp. NBC_01198]|uniref:hypothetical protein n=1 Tax=Streptomyces sp. NBC_01198 TaxID=2903769 RepID=UPI002E0E2841|nr:hypothetical protein OG702_32260 [Streptomyces sp. NBC_01198]